MTRIGPLPEVTILRAGYASTTLYLTAIASALSHGREVRAIDSEGQVTHLPEPLVHYVVGVDHAASGEITAAVLGRVEDDGSITIVDEVPEW